MYQWTVMPFGLNNSPAIFQRLMDCLLAGLTWEICLVYLDDIIIFSDTIEKHLERLSLVLQRIINAGMKLNLDKCSFLKQQVEYLGHIVGSNGVSPLPDKVKAIQDFPQPTNAKQLRSFLGCIGFYRRFLPNFATIASPLYTLTEKNRAFVWKDQHQQAFDTLKKRMVHDIVLKFPDFRREFCVTTDASGIGLGAILSQTESDGSQRPICFASRVLNKAEKNYSTTERELLGIVYALDTFRPYLYGKKFVLKTDHAPLTFMKTCKNPSDRLMRWICKIQEFDFDIVYKAGYLNEADALSRSPVLAVQEKVQRQLVDLQGPITLDEICDAQLADPLLKIFREIDDDIDIPKSDPTMRTLWRRIEDISEKDGVLYIIDDDKKKIILPPSLHNAVLNEMHNTPFAGHLGVTRTLSSIRERYYWPGLHSIVNTYVKKCRDCAMFKRSNINTLPPLIPITATEPLECIEVDVVGPFKESSKGNRYILTMIDIFTRWPEAYAIKNQETETILACLEDFVSRHGMPRSILTDQGKQFESQLFKNFCHAFNIQKKRTTSYHPACNGQIERFNGTIVKTIARFVSADQRDWCCYIPAALHAYRTTVHNTTKMTPFELLYARTNRLPMDLLTDRDDNTVQIDELDYAAKAHKRLREAYKQVIETQKIEQVKYKANYDRKTTEFTFNVGDRVYLASKMKKIGLSPKLQCKWLGPYTVVERKGEVDYVIQADDKPNKLVVCHQSRLKPCFTDKSPIIKKGRVIKKQIENFDMEEAEQQNNIETINQSESDNSDDDSDSDDEIIISRNQTKPIVADDIPAQAQIADKPQVALRRSQRTGKQPQRYTPINCVYTGRSIFSLKTIMLMILLSFGLLNFAYVTECSILSDDIGEALTCAVGVDGSLFSLGHEPDCSMPDSIKQRLITHVTVKPYFRRSFSPVFKVWSCQIQHEIVSTYSGFFGSRGITNHKITFMPVSEDTCHSIANSLELEKPTGLHKISSFTYTNDTQPLHIDYRYCCYEVVNEQRKLIVKQISASYNYITKRMFSAATQMQSCSPNKTSCMLQDQILVWLIDSYELCDLVSGPSVLAERRGEKIVSEEGQFSVTLSAQTRICSVLLFTTKEGLLIQIRHATKIRHHDLETVIKTQTNDTTTIIATIAYVETYLEDLTHRLFRINWMNICQIQKSRYHFFRTLSVLHPTLSARALLQDERITARLAGQYLSVWTCSPIREYELRIINNDYCYNDVPISYTNNKHMHDAFLNLAELEIIPYSKPLDCKHVTSQYVHMTRNRTAYWNGKNLTYVDLHVNDIVLMTAYPKSREFHLMASKINDPNKDQFDKLTRLLDVENSIRALTKLLEVTALEVDIDPAELKYLAQTAGIESINFANSLLNKTIKFFTPPKWLISLFIISIIFIIICLIIYCFPNSLRIVTTNLNKIFNTRRNNDMHMNEMIDIDKQPTEMKMDDKNDKENVDQAIALIDDITPEIAPEEQEAIYADEQIAEVEPC